jgi:hypothetical protein
MAATPDPAPAGATGWRALASSYRTRLFLAIVFVVAVALGLVLVSLPRLLEGFFLDQEQANLRTRADAVAALLADELSVVSGAGARPILLPNERGGRPRQRDFYVLDEIAIEYEYVDGQHAIGPDQDQQEMVAGLIKRFAPRRASGDFLSFKMSASEFLIFCVLCHKARQGSGGVPAEQLLAELRPAVAVISVGRNRYGHPAPAALQRLRIAGVDIWRTDLEGTVSITTDGSTMTVRGRRGTVARSVQ